MRLFTSLIERGSIPLLERVTRFTQERQRVLAENVANIDTPGYRAKQVDVGAFQAELRRAALARRSVAAPLELRHTREVRFLPGGGLQLQPGRAPPENLLFHDGTNSRVERQMALLAENGAAHQLAVELLKGRFGGLLTAIRGRMA